jgi:zinc/manganese transport system permease protein
MTATFFVFAHPFLESAFGAGTAIALVSGLVGYVVVLRGQVFAGDALSHVAFTGALAALALGVDLRLGLYGGCVAFGLLLAVLGRQQAPDDTVIGSVFAWVLGLGALFLSLFTTSSTGVGGSGGTTGVNVLFGSILGLTGQQALADAIISLAVVVAFVAIARPLLFASLDPAVAGSRGVPVRSLSAGFFVLLGVTAGVATQAVGALLLLGLLAAPAGAAQRLTARPFAAMWLSAGIATASMWIGLTVAYLVPRVPPSFGIIGTATAVYLGTFAWTGATRRWGRTAIPSTEEPTIDGSPGAPGTTDQWPVRASGTLRSTP